MTDGSHIMLESMGMPGAFASYNLQVSHHPRLCFLT